MDSGDLEESLQTASSRHQPSSQERGISCNPRSAHPLLEYELLSDMLTRALEEVETLRGMDKKVTTLAEEKSDLRDEMLQILNRSRIVVAEKEYLLASQQVKLTESQKMTAILKRKLEYAEGNAEEIESANRLLKAELAQIKSLREVEQVRNKNALRRAGQEEKDKAADISHFQKEVLRLQNELSVAQDALTRLKDRSAAEHASSEHRIAFLEESLRAEKALSEQQKSTDRQQLLAHVASSRATIAELENELSALKHSSQDTTTALQASLTKERVGLQHEITALQQESEKQRDSFAKERVGLQHEITALKQESEKQRDSFAKERVGLQHEITALKQESEKQRDSFAKERVGLQQEVAALKQESEKQRDSFQSSLATEKSSLQVQVVSLKQELESKMAALKVGYEHEKSAVERDFNVRNEASKQELAALKLALSEEIVKLQNQLKEGEAKEASLLQANEALMQELQDTKRLRNQLQAEGDSLRDELESAAVAQRKAQQKVCEEEALLEAELERVRSELKSKTHSWEEKQRSAERQEGEIQAENRLLKKQNEKKDRELSKLVGQKASLEQRLTASKEEGEQRQKEQQDAIEELTQQVVQQTKRIEQLDAVAGGAELERLRSDLALKTRRLDELEPHFAARAAVEASGRGLNAVVHEVDALVARLTTVADAPASDMPTLPLLCTVTGYPPADACSASPLALEQAPAFPKRRPTAERNADTGTGGGRGKRKLTVSQQSPSEKGDGSTPADNLTPDGAAVGEEQRGQVAREVAGSLSAAAQSIAMLEARLSSASDCATPSPEHTVLDAPSSCNEGEAGDGDGQRPKAKPSRRRSQRRDTEGICVESVTDNDMIEAGGTEGIAQRLQARASRPRNLCELEGSSEDLMKPPPPRPRRSAASNTGFKRLVKAADLKEDGVSSSPPDKETEVLEDLQTTQPFEPALDEEGNNQGQSSRQQKRKLAPISVSGTSKDGAKKRAPLAQLNPNIRTKGNGAPNKKPGSSQQYEDTLPRDLLFGGTSFSMPKLKQSFGFRFD